MKTLKITLSIIVVAVIVFLALWWWIKFKERPPISLPQNPFTERIKQEIASLGDLPDSKFCKDAYIYITYLINDFHKPHPPQYPYGRLGNSQMENDQRKEYLTKELYSAYTEKFIKQAFYVFRNSEWSFADLRFIRSEYQTLRGSTYLESGSPVDKNFSDIHNIFKKYDEITDHISTCRSFSFTNYSLLARFPVDDIQNKITQTNTYLNKGLGEYVNNCTRLHNELKEIPQALFVAHVRYLDNKIREWSDMYMRPFHTSFNDYNNNLGQPTQSEIDALNREMYNVDNFDTEKQRLQNKWNADKQAAYEHWRRN